MDSIAPSTHLSLSRRHRVDVKSPRATSVSLLLVFVLTLLCSSAFPQENYLVTTNDGLVALYDLATNAFIESTKGSLGYSQALNYEGEGVPVRGPNNRLAFVVSAEYISVIDTTLNREIKRLNYTGPTSLFLPQGAITPDGKFLLVTGDSCFQNFCSPYSILFVIDTAQLTVVRKVDLSPALSTARPGALVALNNKVYVFPGFPSDTQKLARVDLTNYSVLPITLPTGNFSSPHMASVTPDGSTVVAFEHETTDRKSHTVLVSTASDMVVGDIAQSSDYSTRSLVITPNGSDASKIFGYISGGINTQTAVAALDLRVNSPTYGQLLTDTTVTLDFYFAIDATAINSDGSRLLIGGYTYGNASNLNVIDTAKMFSDPAHAVIAQLTLDNGNQATGVCTGFFTTTPPNTAPTVSGVSGNIVNDAPRQIDITGGNFQPGALVRIGSMDQLPATVNGGTMLSVTVPVNAPAGKALDIVVTNPQTNAPPDQQNQSGLLAGSFSILPNPKFQPTTQLASINADNSYSVYDLGQQTMVNVQAFQAGNVLFWPALNVDGKELYMAAQTGSDATNVVLPVDLKTNALGTAIPIGGDTFAWYQILASGLDPLSGKPILTIPWITYYNYNDYDMHVSIIDSDSSSPTFNTVLRTFNAGLNTYPYPEAMAVSPDGKFAYIWYGDDADYGSLGIMNLATGAFNHFSSGSLGVTEFQYQVSISPDGKYLLLDAYRANRAVLQLFDLSVPTQPKRSFTFTPKPVPGRGSPVIWNYQVVGDQLYTFDPTGIVVVFNFRKGNFRERGYSVIPNLYFDNNFAFSADGAYLYVTDSANDQITVFDASKLHQGSGALLTNIRAPYYPFAMDVSRVAAPPRSATLRH